MHRSVFILLVLFALHGGAQSINPHLEVSLRMVGQEVLKAVGDRQGLVQPVERVGGAYQITFERPFAFEPDRLGRVIDSVMAATKLSEHYIVSFTHCDSTRVVYSYERKAGGDLLPCLGRTQPEACYRLTLHLLDGYSGPLLDQADAGGGEDRLASILLLLIALLGAAGALAVYLSRKAHDPAVVRIGDFVFSKHRMQLVHDKAHIELTGKEAELLDLLLASINATVEREVILREVWGDEGDYVGRTLDVFISKLRKKLEGDGRVHILNIRGVGYKLVVED
jgi:hypothetical protein